MLKGLCDNNQVDNILDMFLLMVKTRSDLSLDITHSYNILIDGSSKSRNSDKAKDLFKEITLKGLQPND
jgi:pentatricopeptide repeat protein